MRLSSSFVGMTKPTNKGGYEMNRLYDIKPTGDMVECVVMDCCNNVDVALWGCSGAMGEPYSFFEPRGKKFTAGEILWWEYKK